MSVFLLMVVPLNAFSAALSPPEQLLEYGSPNCWSQYPADQTPETQLGTSRSPNGRCARGRGENTRFWEEFCWIQAASCKSPPSLRSLSWYVVQRIRTKPQH